MKNMYCWWCNTILSLEPKDGCYNIDHYKYYINNIHDYLYGVFSEEVDNEKD